MAMDVPGMNLALNNFFSTHAENFALQRLKQLQEIEMAMNPVLAEVKALDANFDFEPLTSRSFYSVKSPGHYEVLLSFRGIDQEEISIEDGQTAPGYAMARLSGKKMISRWKFCSGNSNPSKVYISATIVRKRLVGYISEAVKSLQLQKNLEVKQALDDDVITLLVSGNDHEPCLVDLVPAIPFPERWVLSAHAWETKRSDWPNRKVKDDVMKCGFHLIAKPNPSKSSYQWQISFSSPTRKLLEIDMGCRTKCLLILEVLLEDIQSYEAGLNELHLKTVILRVTEQFPVKSLWSEDKFAKRFMDAVKELEQCLGELHLGHVFLPNVNLLRDVQKLALQKCKDGVKKILDDTELFLSTFELCQFTTSL